MTTESPPPAVFRFGRLVLWLVLALMVLSILYGGWHVVANWPSIRV
jgi:hypothetical protein